MVYKVFFLQESEILPPIVVIICFIYLGYCSTVERVYASKYRKLR